MKKNMGTADRIIRLLVVAALVVLYVTGTVTGLWGTIALVVAAIFTLTSFVGFCPIYALVGVKTCKVS
ncbi:YgaP family membrane protein [Roseivirga sp.]|uniref:YgaP family membrane protein n=1 Tax=Roseivirga sp. TaxID=1964215 RepID=UPI003B522708